MKLTELQKQRLRDKAKPVEHDTFKYFEASMRDNPPAYILKESYLFKWIHRYLFKPFYLDTKAWIIDNYKVEPNFLFGGDGSDLQTSRNYKYINTFMGMHIKFKHKGQLIQIMPRIDLEIFNIEWTDKNRMIGKREYQFEMSGRMLKPKVRKCKKVSGLYKPINATMRENIDTLLTSLGLGK